MARIGQDKLTPVSVAVTDQVCLSLLVLKSMSQWTDWQKPATDLTTEVWIIYKDVHSHPE